MTEMEILGNKLREYDPTASESTKEIFNLFLDMHIAYFNDIQRQLDEALARIRYLENGSRYKQLGK